MKKNYYVPATEVIALIGCAIMQAASPDVNPNSIPIPDSGSGIG